jgi:hypothetical protein
MTRLWAGEPKNQDLIHIMDERFFSSLIEALRLTHPCIHLGTWSSILMGKMIENEADHSPPSSAKFKNSWNCIPNHSYVFMTLQ